jgi:hypothetical protein
MLLPGFFPRFFKREFYSSGVQASFWEVQVVVLYVISLSASLRSKAIWSRGPI